MKQFENGYCLECGEWVFFSDGWHLKNMTRDEFGNWDVEFCTAENYTTSAPPELDMSDLVDPSEDDLIFMDMSAEVLLSDFGVNE
jgi:hypothetical protein